MRISDWSSDVCSSDLQVHRRLPATVEPGAVEAERRARAQAPAPHLAVESLHGRQLGGAQVHVIETAERHGRGTSSGADTLLGRAPGMAPLGEPKSVVAGKGVSVRVVYGGGRRIK